jgi:hypothetical protein
MRSRRLVVALALLAAACSARPPLPPEWREAVGGIHGSWRGTWGGAPVALLITDQRTTAGSSGPERLGVSGILTSRINDEPTSVAAHVWLGGVEGALTLWVRAESPSGTQRMTLRQDGRTAWSGWATRASAGARRARSS